MQGRRNPFVAREGIPFLVLAFVAACATPFYLPTGMLLLPLSALVLLFLVFRDPVRKIPSAALGIVSPVDGRVIEVASIDAGALQGRAQRIVIRVTALGSYTARSPIEGQVKDLSTRAAGQAVDYATNAMWIQTDEGDDVVMGFHGYRLGIPPKALVRYGERLGQGQRCAYLRLARLVELHIPFDSKVVVEHGQLVAAGKDLLGSVPHH